jgi:excisionase family DNA binding protein
MRTALSIKDQLINYGINDFCKCHGVGRTLVYDEIKRGELKFIKVGKRTLIPVSEAKAWQHRKSEGAAKSSGIRTDSHTLVPNPPVKKRIDRETEPSSKNHLGDRG